jgi:hypothetical protein
VDDGIIGPATVANLRLDAAALDQTPAIEPTPQRPDDPGPAPSPPTLSRWQRFWRWLFNL